MEATMDAAPAWDGATVAAAMLGVWLLSRAPVDASARWVHEPIALDQGLRGRRRVAAAHWSDATLVGAALVPLGAALGTSPDRDTALDRGLVLAEVEAVTLFANATVKTVVMRPRPLRYARAAGTRGDRDEVLSFYSGHAAVSFASAVAGGVILASSDAPAGIRAGAWAGGLGLATATAALRVEAGKHFWTDVAVGAAAGTLAGVAIPIAHGAVPRLTTTDGVAMVGGVVAGALCARLLHAPVVPVPLAFAGGAGFGIAGVLR